jgi:SAM-dependent methyltransferase
VHQKSYVLDFGAGRGAFAEDVVAYRRDLRRLRGYVAEITGVDVDPAVEQNPTLDRALTVEDTSELPFGDESFDLIVADWVFEHVADPVPVARELRRVLKAGGWVCARTPNRWGVTGVAARVTPNRFHVVALRKLQPDKKERDTFPTTYRLNSPKQLRQAFPETQFDHFTYAYASQPTYAGRSYVAGRMFQAVTAVTPPPLRSTLMVFLRKKG